MVGDREFGNFMRGTPLPLRRETGGSRPQELDDRRQWDAGVLNRMAQAHHSGHTSEAILAESLAEDTCDVALHEESAFQILLHALVAVLTVSTVGGALAEHEGVSEDLALGVAREDRSPDIMRGGVAAGPDASVPSHLTQRGGGDAGCGGSEAAGDGDPVAIVSSGVGVHSDAVRLHRVIRRIDDQEVVRGTVLRQGGDSAGRWIGVTDEAVGEVREVLEVQDLRLCCGRWVTSTLDGDGRGSCGDRNAQLGLGIERGANGAFTIVVDGGVLGDEMPLWRSIATVEQQGCLRFDLGLAEDLLVVGIQIEAEERVSGRNNRIAEDWLAVLRGANLCGEATFALHLDAEGDDLIPVQRVGGVQRIQGCAAGVHDVLRRKLLAEHHEELLGLEAADPGALLGVESGQDLSAHTHQLFHALVDRDAVARPINI